MLLTIGVLVIVVAGALFAAGLARAARADDDAGELETFDAGMNSFLNRRVVQDRRHDDVPVAEDRRSGHERRVGDREDAA